MSKSIEHHAIQSTPRTLRSTHTHTHKRIDTRARTPAPHHEHCTSERERRERTDKKRATAKKKKFYFNVNGLSVDCWDCVLFCICVLCVYVLSRTRIFLSIIPFDNFLSAACTTTTKILNCTRLQTHLADTKFSIAKRLALILRNTLSIPQNSDGLNFISSMQVVQEPKHRRVRLKSADDLRQLGEQSSKMQWIQFVDAKQKKRDSVSCRYDEMKNALSFVG